MKSYLLNVLFNLKFFQSLFWLKSRILVKWKWSTLFANFNLKIKLKKWWHRKNVTKYAYAVALAPDIVVHTQWRIDVVSLLFWAFKLIPHIFNKSVFLKE